MPITEENYIESQSAQFISATLHRPVPRISAYRGILNQQFSWTPFVDTRVRPLGNTESWRDRDQKGPLEII